MKQEDQWTLSGLGVVVPDSVHVGFVVGHPERLAHGFESSGRDHGATFAESEYPIRRNVFPSRSRWGTSGDASVRSNDMKFGTLCIP